MRVFRFFAPVVCLLLPGLAGAEWYKGVTHVHSLWSDGDTAPEMIAAWYKERGWDFMSFSDHNILQEGEKYVSIVENTKLSPADVEAIRAKFGEDWVETKQEEGSLRMRLKTHAALKAHFDAPEKFMMFVAEEITSGKHGPHVNALNIRELIEAGTGNAAELIQRYIDQVKAQREKYGVPMTTHINHVNFSDGVTTEELLKVRGLEFFEVYNGHPAVFNWGNPAKGMPNTERHWDVIQSINLLRDPHYVLYGVATDDSHEYKEFKVGNANPGRGWVMVEAEALDPDAIVGAMMAGRFYASTGVTLDKLQHDERSLRFSIQPEEGVEYRTQFIGTRKGFDESSEPLLDDQGAPLPRASHQYSDEIGVVLQETEDLNPSYTFTGDELYVRAKVISDRLQENPFDAGDVEMAWVQPVLVRGQE